MFTDVAEGGHSTHPQSMYQGRYGNSRGGAGEGAFWFEYLTADILKIANKVYI